ncbi:hypothetical protein RXV86_18585 [Alisedimentitalea sp. MJ-SS2]|uniref:hypothetical protein n=1 Tax=Aliisedimentitalea sp. MJ-SS2 TaxID=3049795 RepID=UPI002912910A|nr:hypothetical protein [Alisedimentitalea sp. MJ-SS2]MDU8929406.1 hypothetical protein [Alisedimentitalea sp. MJ-SS2]
MFWKYPVSDEMQHWIADGFVWAVEAGLLTVQTPLVLPNKTFFTAPSGRNEATVKGLIADIARIVGVSDANIEVAQIEKLPPEYRHNYQSLGDTAGTWQGDTEQSLIRYDAELFARPVTMIATLAHEFMHEVLHLHVDGSTLPGGAEAEELSTDLHVITSGFGVIQLAGAEQIGWQGYLSQPSRAHALALFLRVTESETAVALENLPPRSAKYLRRAMKFLKANPGDVQRIQDSFPSPA